MSVLAVKVIYRQVWGKGEKEKAVTYSPQADVCLKNDYQHTTYKLATSRHVNA